MSIDGQTTLIALAQQVAGRLADGGQRLVLAESCTSGLIAATIAGVPGISNFFCGSSVVYRDDTKQKWLGIQDDLLSEFTSVSQQASTAIALAVLERTPEATISLGITGHLGPDAPADIDGTTFLSIWIRGEDGLSELTKSRIQLSGETRAARQQEASRNALQLLTKCLAS